MIWSAWAGVPGRGGRKGRRLERGVGWPASPEDKPQMWGDISLAHNASRVAFPILLQAADGLHRTRRELATRRLEAVADVDS